MSLQMDIKGKIKDAMMAKETVRLDVLRGMSAAFTNELVAKGKKPQDELSDEEALAVIVRLSKQRKDSIEQFGKANRPELVEEETAQLKVIEEFLPTYMSAEEIRPLAEAKMKELGITDKAKSGQLTGMLMKDLKGKADGTVVKQVVDSLFS
jgi:uncharacterized protein YqeY